MMQRFMPVLAWIAALAASPHPAAAAAPKMFALVIANVHYSTGAVSGVIPNASLMESALKAVGFDPVQVVPDAKLADMNAALEALKKANVTGGTVVVYYAGHAVQVNGQNYLVAVDASWDSLSAIAATSVSMDDVFAAVRQAGAVQNIVFFDACRDNAFAATAGTDFSPGLRQPQNPPKNTLISYAAPPNRTTGGDSSGSLYTKLLALYMREPGLSVIDLLARLDRTIGDVADFPDDVPWSTGSLATTYYFQDPVFVHSQISRADDTVIVSFGDVDVDDSATKGFSDVPYALKVGDNNFTVRVWNQRSFTPLLTGMQPEGWNYTVDIRAADGRPLVHLEDGENRPDRDGPRFGKSFVVAKGTLRVDADGAVHLTYLDPKFWIHN